MQAEKVALNPEGSDPSNPFVPREDYESLKARYEALLAQSDSPAAKGTKKRKRARPSVLKAEKSDTKIDGDKRKVRSLKLEVSFFPADQAMAAEMKHLIHQMTNRRLGVAYTISPYNIPGNKDLPEPSDTAPGPDESVNGVQEFRPDFRADSSDKDIKAFLDLIRDDVRGAWDTAEPVDAQQLEEEQVRPISLVALLDDAQD